MFLTAGTVDEERVTAHLITLGDVAQLVPEYVPKRAFMLVQSVIASPTITTVGKFSSFIDLILQEI